MPSFHFSNRTSGASLGVYNGPTVEAAWRALAADASFDGPMGDDVVATPVVLVAQRRDGEWTVTDGTLRWWPAGEAADEIDASDDPEATVLRICESAPMRGEWR